MYSRTGPTSKKTILCRQHRSVVARSGDSIVPQLQQLVCPGRGNADVTGRPYEYSFGLAVRKLFGNNRYTQTFGSLDTRRDSCDVRLHDLFAIRQHYEDNEHPEFRVSRLLLSHCSSHIHYSSQSLVPPKLHEDNARARWGLPSRDDSIPRYSRLTMCFSRSLARFSAST